MTAPIWIPQSLALVDMGCVWKKNYMALGGGNDPRAAADKTLAELASIRQSVEHVILCLDARILLSVLAALKRFAALRKKVGRVSFSHDLRPQLVRRDENGWSGSAWPRISVTLHRSLPLSGRI